MQLINKDDIGAYVQFSANYFSEQTNFHIRDAQQIDLQPILPAQLITDLQALVNSNPKAYDRNKSYLTGEICFVMDSEVKTFYKAINATTDRPPTSDWQQHELLNFWQQFVKPLHAVFTFGRIIVESGVHVAQGGFREHLDPTSTEVSDKRKAEMLGQNDGRIGYYRMALEKKLNDVNFTFDGVKYENNNCKQGRGRTRIIAVGAKRVYKTRFNEHYNDRFGFSDDFNA
jgi:hypothetical protein